MTILTYYANLTRTDFSEDPLQANVVVQLEGIQIALLRELRHRRHFGLLRKRKCVHGMYLWGGVGVGKTLLLDCFYESLPTDQKLRMHFFEFMRYIHDELRKLSGKKNPLTLIAKQLSRQAVVLCFDEFFVKDIVDAMLLGELLQCLFKEGITIVTTSNIEPDKLYERGLQRGNFLPAIAALKQHTDVVHLRTSTDYRLQAVTAHGVYFVPADEQADREMQHLFALLSHGNAMSHAPITIANRAIPIKQEAHDVIWFDFKVLCHVPRSQQDYLFLAERYQYVFISNLPRIKANEKNTIRLFITLIDILYDHHCRLVLSANVGINEIYTEGDMLFEFARTASRLTEMQSTTYFTYKTE